MELHRGCVCVIDHDLVSCVSVCVRVCASMHTYVYTYVSERQKQSCHTVGQATPDDFAPCVCKGDNAQLYSVEKRTKQKGTPYAMILTVKRPLSR